MKTKNKNTKKNKMTLVALVLLLIAIIGTGIYAYWAGTVADPEDHTDNQKITIGMGQEVNTKLNVSKELNTEGMKLVPAGKTSVSVGGEEENIEEFTATYTVEWVEDGDADIITSQDNIMGTLTTTVNNITINGATANTELINVSIDPEEVELTAEGDAEEITIKVTLTEPADKAQYDAIAEGEISLDLTFSLAQ